MSNHSDTAVATTTDATPTAATERADRVQRRDLVSALLGLVGAGAAASVLEACASESPTPRDGPLGRAIEAAAGSSVGWVTTIAAPIGGGQALRNSTPSNFSGAQVAIAEYYTNLGDGGGGVFYWDGAVTAAQDDGGTIFFVSGGGWRRIYAGPLNLRWFGAQGNNGGGKGDTDALQNWLQAIPGSGGQGYIPAGVYAFTSPLSITDQVSISGAGSASILLAHLHSDQDGRTVGSLTAFTVQVQLADFAILSNGNVQHCLRLNNLARAKLRNVHAAGGTRTGTTGFDVYVYGCLICDFDLVVSSNASYPGLTNPGVSPYCLVYLQNANPANPTILSQCNANHLHLVAEGGATRSFPGSNPSFQVAVFQDDQGGAGDNHFSGTIDTGSTNVSAGPSVGGILYAQGQVGLPSSVVGNAYWGGSYAGGVSGKLYIGQHSNGGQRFIFATRDGDVDTDRFTFWDNGLVDVVSLQVTGNELGFQGSNPVGQAPNGPQIFYGAGSPNGVYSAPPGSLYLNTNGGGITTFYVKESGTSNTGWVPK
jgi:hypothetical protein